MYQRIFCTVLIFCIATISYCQPNKREISRLRQFLTANIIDVISDANYTDSQSNELFLIAINLNDSSKIKSINILYTDSSSFINQYRKLAAVIQGKFIFNEKMPKHIIIPVYLEFYVCCSKKEIIDAGLIEYLKSYKKPYSNKNVYVFPLLGVETIYPGKVK